MACQIFKVSDGTVQCLYSDLLDLKRLGRLEVTGASVVEFNPEAQLWEVKIGGQLPYQSPSREECLRWEKSYLEDQLLQGVGKTLMWRAGCP